MDRPDLMRPTIHLNGTSKKELIEQLMAVCYPLNETITKLGQAAPNGRDYYPQGPDAIQRAIDQHTDRLERLKSVSKDIHALLVGIDP